jgi:hypothetical protein
MVGLSYRPSKRLAKGHREQEGAGGESNRRKSKKFKGRKYFRGATRAVPPAISGCAPGEQSSCGQECTEPAALEFGRGAARSSGEALLAPEAARAESTCGGVGEDGGEVAVLFGENEDRDVCLDESGR